MAGTVAAEGFPVVPGVVEARIERNVGFRKIEVRGRQVYVNGQRVKLAGACHHEFDPLSGRANTMRHAETDVRLLKEAPDEPRIYKVSDVASVPPELRTPPRRSRARPRPR